MEPTFKIGDKAVYPAQGVTEIMGIESMQIGDVQQNFYVLRVLDTDKKIRIPINKVNAVGLRPVIQGEEVEANKTLTALNAALQLTTDTREDDGSKSMRKLDLLEDKKGLNPEVELKKKEVTEFLTRGLSRKERLIILLYYYEELTMREIGEALDLSESRVCQLHSRIILRLKSQMQKFQTELMS